MRVAPSRRRGLTLVELLVVVSIIGLLLSLLIPAVQHARASSRRMQCQSQLHQLGIALDMYLDVQGFRGKFPWAAVMPSITPSRPSMREILGPWMGNEGRVFGCPADPEFFLKEGLSYEYPTSRAEGKTRVEYLRDRPSATVWIMYDFDAVHGPKESGVSRNFLYLDGHVGT